jgi:hypothetical protein
VSDLSQLGGGCRGWFLMAAAGLLAGLPANAQVIEYAADSASVAWELAVPSAATVEPAIPVSPVFNQGRILGVMPDYQTVRDTTHSVEPLSVRQKWSLATMETLDPFNFATAFLTAAESQAGNQTPRFGEGWANYGRRVYAAQLDFATQNYFSAGVLATALHQDPRYFRKGPQAKFLTRIVYSISRLVIARQDSGREAFNASNIGGTFIGIAASNLYYPAASRNGTVMFGRVWTSLMGGAVGNLMSEFWPDVQERVFKHKSH